MSKFINTNDTTINLDNVVAIKFDEESYNIVFYVTNSSIDHISLPFNDEKSFKKAKKQIKEALV